MVKNPPANARDASSIFWSEISPEVENGNPFQYSFLGKSTNKSTWQATVRGATKSPIDRAYTHTHVTRCSDLQNNFKVGSILANDQNAFKTYSMFRWAMLYIPHVSQIGYISTVLGFYWQTHNIPISASFTSNSAKFSTLFKMITKLNMSLKIHALRLGRKIICCINFYSLIFVSCFLKYVNKTIYLSGNWLIYCQKQPSIKL